MSWTRAAQRELLASYVLPTMHSITVASLLSLGLLMPTRVPVRAPAANMVAPAAEAAPTASGAADEPLLLRAAKGLPVERPPVCSASHRPMLSPP